MAWSTIRPPPAAAPRPPCRTPHGTPRPAPHPDPAPTPTSDPAPDPGRAAGRSPVRAATIHDVARLAGTSAATVSNLLNGRAARVGAATRAAVERAIAELDWRPSEAARQLRAGRARMLGLIVPSVENPFHGAFARLVEGAAAARGHHVVLCNALREPARERRYAEALWSMGVRGLILGSSPPDLAPWAELLGRGLRLVVFDRAPEPPAAEGPDVVSLDNHAAGRRAAEHLLALGHRRIAFVAGNVLSASRAARVAGWREAMRREDLGREAGGRPAPGLLWRGAPGAEAEGTAVGREAARALLGGPRPPTAVVAVNDVHALGVIAGVHDEGLRVPEDVSVAGVDDIALAAVVRPALTTVRQPLAAMAEAAVDLLVRRLEGEAGPPRSLLFPAELVVRQSTAPPAGSKEALLF